MKLSQLITALKHNKYPIHTFINYNGWDWIKYTNFSIEQPVHTLWKSPAMTFEIRSWNPHYLPILTSYTKNNTIHTKILAGTSSLSLLYPKHVIYNNTTLNMNQPYIKIPPYTQWIMQSKESVMISMHLHEHH